MSRLWELPIKEPLNNWQQLEQELEIGILLAYSAEQVIRKRKFIENLCGYGDGYGGDKLVLEKLQEYLNRPRIKVRLNELLAEIKKTN